MEEIIEDLGLGILYGAIAIGFIKLIMVIYEIIMYL